MGKKISKRLGGKYIQKLLDHTRKSVTVALETVAKKVIQKIAEAILDRKKMYMSLEERQQIIDELRSI